MRFGVRSFGVQKKLGCLFFAPRTLRHFSLSFVYHFLNHFPDILGSYSSRLLKVGYKYFEKSRWDPMMVVYDWAKQPLEVRFPGGIEHGKGFFLFSAPV